MIPQIETNEMEKLRHPLKLLFKIFVKDPPEYLVIVKVLEEA